MQTPEKILKDHFSCFICLQEIKSALMLTCCSKFACKKCLDSWSERRSYSYSLRCPHCQRETNKPVTVPSIDQLYSEIKEFAKKYKGVCPKHEDYMKYYCTECEEPCCSDGLAIHGLHKEHKLVIWENFHTDLIRNIQSTKTTVSEIDTKLDRTLEQAFEAKKRAYLEQINAYVSLVEKRMDRDIGMFGSKYAEIIENCKNRISEISENFELNFGEQNELLRNEGKGLKLGHDMIKDLGSGLASLDAKIDEEIGQMEIPNEVVPKGKSTKMFLSDQQQPVVCITSILNISIFVSIIENQLVVSCAVQEDISFYVCIEAHDLRFECFVGYREPSNSLDLSQFNDITELTIFCRPSTFKDAYKAALLLIDPLKL